MSSSPTLLLHNPFSRNQGSLPFNIPVEVEATFKLKDDETGAAGEQFTDVLLSSFH
jgi:hypothetical protein